MALSVTHVVYLKIEVIEQQMQVQTINLQNTVTSCDARVQAINKVV